MAQDNEFSYLNTEQGKNYEAMLYQVAKENWPQLRKNGPIEADGELKSGSVSYNALTAIINQDNASSREDIEKALVLRYQQSLNGEENAKAAKDKGYHAHYLKQTGEIDADTRKAIDASRTEHESANQAWDTTSVERMQAMVRYLQHDIGESQRVFSPGAPEVQITGKWDDNFNAALANLRKKNGIDANDWEGTKQFLIKEIQGNEYDKQMKGIPDMSEGGGLRASMTGDMASINPLLDSVRQHYHKEYPELPENTQLAKAKPPAEPAAPVPPAEKVVAKKNEGQYPKTPNNDHKAPTEEVVSLADRKRVQAELAALNHTHNLQYTQNHNLAAYDGDFKTNSMADLREALGGQRAENAAFITADDVKKVDALYLHQSGEQGDTKVLEAKFLHGEKNGAAPGMLVSELGPEGAGPSQTAPGPKTPLPGGAVFTEGQKFMIEDVTKELAVMREYVDQNNHAVFSPGADLRAQEAQTIAQKELAFLKDPSRKPEELTLESAKAKLEEFRQEAHQTNAAPPPQAPVYVANGGVGGKGSKISLS